MEMERGFDTIDCLYPLSIATRHWCSTCGVASNALGIQQERMRWAWAQKQRLLAAQTRFLPRIDTFSVSLRREIPIPGWLEGLVVTLILGALLVFQALNLFHASYTSDEGTLMANAQA